MKRHNGEYPCPIVPIPGWMSGPELEWLYQQAKRHRVIVEVGSAYGRSSHALLTGNWEGFGPEGRVYCVDCWPKPKDGTKDKFDYGAKATDRRGVFFQRVGHFPNLQTVELPSLMFADAVAWQDWEPDMVFLDGGTAQMGQDINTWGELVHGLLCGHDYDPLEYPGVVKAVEGAFGRGFYVAEGTRIWCRGRQC